VRSGEPNDGELPCSGWFPYVEPCAGLFSPGWFCGWCGWFSVMGSTLSAAPENALKIPSELAKNSVKIP
jgi:hypothetical protein